MELPTVLEHATQARQVTGVIKYDFSGSRLFIPISLGNHYYSRKILRDLLRDFITPSKISTIFLCDQLRRLSYLIKGETDEELVSNRVASQLAEMKAMLSNCGYEESAMLNIVSWTDVADDPRLKEVILGVKNLINTDRTLSWQIDEACQQLLGRFGSRDSNQNNIKDIQKEYLVSETSLSIYMNECVGYDFEVYRKKGDIIDFIYESRSDEVRSISRRSCKRTLISLEQFWGADDHE